MAKQIERIDFQLVCRRCDGFGIVFEGVEDASPSTVIQCRKCGSPRGTLGQLRALSLSSSVDQAKPEGSDHRPLRP
ncbi:MULTISPECIES: hypothetical protein [Bradyrhizobium]|jgi:ribosomal protein L40E|uniref:hypothetical protein n=1 Tax=Bradyrhizobium TaxID=374 RepID=UPI0003F7AF38|nr:MULTISPECIES: hypothetical protein [Bradyrhizobium]AUC99085.1 hypothetical protein CWS35_36190 [Bradyrhizobium sp. SK17]KIU51778.1 hypothetical protein QU41_04375 [Bradyrhizobium elkanii]OCX28486.1 hypothetical protein QU42_25925 [Bradyrhizobium sp. UASWS1016]